MTLDLKSVARRQNKWNQPTSAMQMLAQAAELVDMGGCSLKLIIKKKLFKSDVDKAQNRLSMPLNQISDDDFLNQDEKMRSTENGVDVGFIGPCREETTMVLKKWNYASSSSYVLINNWYEIAMNNGLNEGDAVQVWFFRVDDHPWFALVKV